MELNENNFVWENLYVAKTKLFHKTKEMDLLPKSLRLRDFVVWDQLLHNYEIWILLFARLAPAIRSLRIYLPFCFLFLQQKDTVIKKVPEQFPDNLLLI